MKMSPAASIFCVVALLFLVTNFSELCTSDEHSGSTGIYANSSINIQEANNKKALEIEVHGILFWASMGFLMPVGILTMRMSSSTVLRPSKHRILFYVHAALQMLSMVVVTVGAVLSIRQFENAFNNIHQKIGLALYIAIYLQVLIGFIRPNWGNKGRKAWYFVHWMFGTGTCVVGILNVYTGLHAYHRRTSRNTTLWTIVFTAQVCLMTILFLFQDKWEYIQKQGMVVSESDVKGSPAQSEMGMHMS